MRMLEGTAAEAAARLALIIAIYRHYKTTNLNRVDSMRGRLWEPPRH